MSSENVQQLNNEPQADCGTSSQNFGNTTVVRSQLETNKIYHGNCLDVLKTFPDNCIDCCITSPPYWGLRDYGTAKWEGGDKNCKHLTPDNDLKNAGEKQQTNVGSVRYEKDICRNCGAKRIDEQIGLEKTPEEFVAKMILIFDEVKRVLKPTGTLWLNLGDSYVSGKSRYSTKAQTIEGGGEKEEKYGSMHNGNKPDLYYHPFLKDKDIAGIPWRVAFALQQAGWYLRQDIIWHKPNPMPESVTDRCTKAHEYIFLLSKSNQYYFDYESIQEIATGFDGRKDTMMKGSNKYKTSVVPGQEEHTMASRGHERWKFKGTGTFGNRNGELNGLHSGKKYNPKFKNLQEDGQQPNTIHIKRAEGESDEVYPIRNKRSVWTVNTMPYKDAHFATFPERLITDCIKAGCPENGIVLDPFSGAGTTALVARKLYRNFVGIELNEKYIEIANKRLSKELGMFR